MSLIVFNFLQSTSVLSFYIDVVLTLYIWILSYAGIDSVAEYALATTHLKPFSWKIKYHAAYNQVKEYP